MRVARPLILLAVLAAFGLGSTAQAAPRTVIFNLTESPLDQPEQFSFQANSGPLLTELTWTGWGSATTVGSGSYVLDCTHGGSACGARSDLQRYPATYTLSGRISCPRLGKDARTYRKGIVRYERPEGTKTSRFDPGDSCAKRPSRAAAARAVKRYLRKRGPARKITVSCRASGGNDRECRARYTQRGTRRAGDFYVFARRGQAPGVNPLGG